MSETTPCRLFLLGGYDLEMTIIKHMLEERDDCMVLDRQLLWDNAKLSAYEHDWENHADSDVYGVELQEDCQPPAHYHRIDHHNELTDYPSSLEQVAQVLGIALNRDQQLAAANDRGYIPAMMALGATESEIADIRHRDRAAQGISKEEERLAEKSVEQHLSKHDGLLVVRSLTSRFSPICDRLYPYRSLLVYTDAEWMFYGEGKDELAKRLVSEIKQRKVFHGGGTNGYIGSVKNAYSHKDICDFVNKTINEYEHI